MQSQRPRVNWILNGLKTPRWSSMTSLNCHNFSLRMWAQPSAKRLFISVCIQHNRTAIEWQQILIWMTGEYSCLKAEFYLQRALGYHLVQSYLPTILIVVISWVSFWLDVEAIPARITLGVTTLLTISSKGSVFNSNRYYSQSVCDRKHKKNIFSMHLLMVLIETVFTPGAGIQSNLPPVSYAKAIDVWMGACTIFVFTALLEFTLVNYLCRIKAKKNRRMSLLYQEVILNNYFLIINFWKIPFLFFI